MPNVLRDLFLPTASQYYNAAESIDTARKEYDAAFAELRNYEDRQEQIDRDEVWDALAKQGKLSGTTAAKALGQIRAAKQNRLAAAQMKAQMYRAAARQRQSELGAMAKSATAGDVLNLGMKVGGTALGLAGAGAFTKPITAAAGATEAQQATAATQDAARYNPVMAGVGEALGGIGGGAMTQAATRGRYPELTKNPWDEYYKQLMAKSGTPVAGTTGYPDFGADFPDLQEDLYRGRRSTRYPRYRPRGGQ